MKSVKKILKYQEKIIELCKKTKSPTRYIKIDDLAIDCLAGPAGRNQSFMHAYEDLVANGRLEICGNSLRIRQ